MRTLFTYLLALTCSAFFLGCSGKVSTTDDSTKIELEGPKVETGEEPVDMNPGTDKDIDVDTPLPGDS